jgi:hypothetical protein
MEIDFWCVLANGSVQFHAEVYDEGNHHQSDGAQSKKELRDCFASLAMTEWFARARRGVLL